MILRRFWVTLIGVTIPFMGLLAQSRCAVYARYQDQPLSEVLHHLEKQCNTTFSMNESDLSRFIITKNFEGALLPTVLDILLTEVGYEYEFQASGRSTIIRPRNPVEFTIHGTILDDSIGVPLYMATARCASFSNVGCNSSPTGHFTLQFSSNKPERIIFSYVGKIPVEVVVSPNQPKRHLQIRLKDKLVQYGVNITSGGELKVKIEDAAGKIAIDPSGIGYLSGLGEADVFRSLQLLPGVTVGDESAAGLSIRGGTEDQNLILLDGITLYEPNHFFGLVSAFNNNAIKDVKLHRGAYDARFGGRVSSVIEVIGRPHKRQDSRVGGALNIMNANVYREKRYKETNLSFMVAGRRSYGDFIRNRLFDKLLDYQLQEGSIAPRLRAQLLGNPAQSPTFWFGDLNAKATYTTAKKDRIQVAGYYGRDHLSFSHQDWQPFNYQQNIQYHLRQTNEGLSGSWHRAWTGDWHTQTEIAYSAFSGTYQYAYEVLAVHEPTSRIISQDNQIQDWTLRHHQQIDLSDRLTIEAGLSESRIKVSSRNTMANFTDTLSNQIIDPGVKDILSIYGQGAYQIFDWLKARAGVRNTYYTGTRKLYVAPRLALEGTLVEGLRAKASWGRYYQYISKIIRLNDVGMGESFWMVGGEQNVPVIQATHGVLGLTYSSNGWNIDLELYDKALQNTFTYGISYDPIFQQFDPDTSRLFTGGEARSRGLDLLVKYKRGYYTGWVSYSLGRTTYQFDELNEGLPFTPNQDKRHIIKIVQVLEIGPDARWNLSLSWLFDSGRPFTDIERLDRINLPGPEDQYLLNPSLSPFLNAQRLPAYHRMDVAGSLLVYNRAAADYENPAKARVGISIYNVYNRQNVSERIPNPTFDEANNSSLTVDRSFLSISPNFFVTLEF